MNQEMNEQTHEIMNECFLIEVRKERKEKLINEVLNKRTDERMNQRTNEWMITGIQYAYLWKKPM